VRLLLRLDEIVSVSLVGGSRNGESKERCGLVIELGFRIHIV
jgi:hypothetical protein